MRKIFLFLCLTSVVYGQSSYLVADGDSPGTYSLLNRILGGTAYEVPDCVHPMQHIAQETDPVNLCAYERVDRNHHGLFVGDLDKVESDQLGVPVFVFYSHVDLDNDRCIIFDRVRTEIKTYAPSPDHLKGYYGETVSFSWDMKLDAGFQPATSFTHLFQVKPVGGDDSMPFITITPRLTSGGLQLLYLIHAGFNSSQVTLWNGQLADFVGTWLHIRVSYTCETIGMFHIDITRKDNDQQLMSYTNNIEMWRTGNEFQRPKWGIYRSLNNRESLRDERVFFNNFCLAKNPVRCG